MPTNFFFILLGQMAVLLAIMYMRKGKMLSARELAISAVAGCGIGLMFDLTLGVHGLVAYLGGDISQSKYGISFEQLVVNGIFSYGISVATARYLPVFGTPLKSKYRQGALVTSGVVLAASGIAAYFVQSGTIVAMVVYGALIISAGELAMLLARGTGPFWRLFGASSVRTVCAAWAWTAGIGFFYELTNLVFPFWQWLPLGTYSVWYVEALMVLLAYVVLIHPMMIVWQIVDGRR